MPGPRTADESVRHENQADCIAGAWTRYTDQQGWLEYPDDIEDIDALFPLIGSAESAGPRPRHARPSGSARSSAGFDSGLGACTAFFPSAPLVGG